MKYTKLLLICLMLRLTAFGQQTNLATDEDYYHLIDRYAILQSNLLIKPFCTSIKPFTREVVGNFDVLLLLDASDKSSTSADRYNTTLLINDNWDAASSTSSFVTSREGRFPNFYKYRGSFFSVDEPDFKLVVNPVLAFDMGYDVTEEKQVFRNTRGAELRGSIANKIGFYSFLSENQFRFPGFYNEWINQTEVVPGAGFIKDFGSDARDFFVARGYVTASPIEQIKVQFGHDRNFIGNGYRSLIMSDFAKENLALKVQTTVWRISYLNLFSEYTDYHSRSAINGVQKKYGAFHYLNFNILPAKLDVGIFEHIIFQHENKGFEAQYLNPIIFYRAVEHGLNSSDNALLGMDWKYNPLPGTSFYGQFVLDEFHKNELFGRTGSWVNKWAFQAGGKWLNAFNVPNLDLQAEYNAVRPYTYTHWLVSQNYTHYNQPIAHPMGSNFKEVLGIVRYQPKPKWNVVVKLFHIIHGADSSASDPTTHYGGDLLKDYGSRPKDDGIKIGDGVRQTTNLVDACLSYQVYHRTYIDLRFVYRDSKREAPLTSQNNTLIYFGLRMNINRMNFDF